MYDEFLNPFDVDWTLLSWGTIAQTSLINEAVEIHLFPKIFLFLNFCIWILTLISSAHNFALFAWILDTSEQDFCSLEQFSMSFSWD